MSTGTVLVVDDNPFIVDFVKMVLRAAGYTVLTAVGGEALRVARAQQPDLILLDLRMPGMDGREVCRRLRADGATAGIPIVAMSAEERLHSTAPLSVDGRLPKPFRAVDLTATVARWAVGARTSQAPAEPPSPSAA